VGTLVLAEKMGESETFYPTSNATIKERHRVNQTTLKSIFRFSLGSPAKYGVTKKRKKLKTMQE